MEFFYRLASIKMGKPMCREEKRERKKRDRKKRKNKINYTVYCPNILTNYPSMNIE